MAPATPWRSATPRSGTPTARRAPERRKRSSSSTWRPIPPPRPRCLLHNKSADQGVSLKFNKSQLPCFSLWKNRQAAIDGYVTGLEPATNFPNRKSFEKEKGRVVQLAAGETRAYQVSFEVHANYESVAEAKRQIALLQNSIKPQVPAPARSAVVMNTVSRTDPDRRGEILTRCPWLTFVLPLAVYMLVGSLEPGPPVSDKSRWIAIPYAYYPAVYTAKIVLTAAAMWWVLPGYRRFPFRVSGWAVPTGMVGVVLWIALCTLGWERKLLTPLGVDALIDFVARTGYNPFAELSGRPPALVGVFLSVRFLGLALLAPIVEEFFLRGFLMRFFVQADWWKVPFGTVHPTAILAAVAYPLLSHPGVEWFAAVAWFLLITLLMFKTRNIWDCVVAHGVTNLLLGLYVVWSGQWQLM